MAPLVICINAEQRKVLEIWVQKDSIDRRMSDRALMILLTAGGVERWIIANRLNVNPCVVTKWKKRFVAHGINGLLDRPRSGRPRKYNEQTEKRVLSVLDKKPPSGSSHWNRFLIAAELGDVKAHQVWRIMKKNNIILDYRRV